MTGKFIVFEGIDGCGKTTQLRLAADYLRSQSYNVLATKEPTDMDIGRKIRVLAAQGNTESSPVSAEQFAELFYDDRVMHLSRRIIPALQQGQIVLCDRHKLSTIAYQSAMGMDINELIQKHQGLYRPDLTLVFEVDLKLAMERIRQTRSSREVFEQEDLLSRVKTNYQTAIAALTANGERFVSIDGNQKLQTVFREVKSTLDQFLRSSKIEDK